jgi:hypothetical protein
LSVTSKHPGIPSSAESFIPVTFIAPITTESLSVSVK